MQNDGELKKFAVFLYLKKLHGNGCIYGYNILKLSRKSGLSRTAIRSHVSFFLKEGWCRMHGKNLVFNGMEKVHDGDGKWIKFSKDVNYKNVKAISIYLRSLVFKNRYIQYDYLRRANHDRIKATSSDYKRAKKAVRICEKYALKCVSDKFSIGYVGIGKLFGCSHTMAMNYVKEMTACGLVKKRNGNNRVLFKCPKNVYVLWRDHIEHKANISNSFWSYGCVMKKEANSYEFL